MPDKKMTKNPKPTGPISHFQCAWLRICEITFRTHHDSAYARLLPPILQLECLTVSILLSAISYLSIPSSSAIDPSVFFCWRIASALLHVQYSFDVSLLVDLLPYFHRSRRAFLLSYLAFVFSDPLVWPSALLLRTIVSD